MKTSYVVLTRIRLVPIGFDVQHGDMLIFDAANPNATLTIYRNGTIMRSTSKVSSLGICAMARSGMLAPSAQKPESEK
jgi:hypothetical protein